ncbi:MAG: methyl-accepting chemotaxis protein [Saccharospirillaceae bacterium]|nr:methyl-accepting chemotaxis protein [Pseudomonadales bacterium]NRB80797.1 methyl-accepting chemotaxis protein [Saccharospirillaceae bacterium]
MFHTNIRTRLTFSFAVLLILLLSISALSYVQLTKQSQTTNILINQDTKQLLIANQININAHASALTLLLILSEDKRDIRIKLYKKMDAQNLLLDKNIEQVVLLNEKSDQDLIAALIQSRTQYKISFISTIELIEFDKDMAFETFSDTSRDLNLLLLQVDKFLEHSQNSLNAKLALNKKETNNSLLMVLIISAIALVIGILLSIFTSKSIISPLKQSVVISQELAEGKLKKRELTPFTDELGEMNYSIKSTSNNLHSLIFNIQQSFENVSLYAKQLLTPVDEVDKGSQNQSKSLSNINQTLDQFLADIDNLSHTSEHATQQAQIARDLAQDGLKRIQLTSEEFKVISNSISQSTQLVKALRERAITVRKMVESIREIADQTNLLALNAAIEAARAGESGRGFSVVADEVRALANRTSQATLDINEQMDGIDSQTQQSVTQISKGKEQLDNGVQLIQDMVEPLTQLNDGAESSLTQLKELKLIIVKQAQASQQIAKDVSITDQLATDNSVAVKSVLKYSQQLTQISQSLEEQINQFKLEG